MASVHVELPEDLYHRLSREAKSRGASVEETLVAILRQTVGGGSERVRENDADLERFVQESGLFATADRKLGPALEKRARDVSPEERERLADALSRGRSLSEMILEDRG